MKKTHSLRHVIVTAFILILLISTYINLRGTYLEYLELGDKYTSIFETNIKYITVVITMNFAITFFIIYFITRGIKKGLKVFFDEEKREMPKLPNKSISLIVSIIVSIIVGNVFTPKIILYASNSTFGLSDMIFNLDISFYMFVEPLIKIALVYIIGMCVGLASYLAMYYILVFNKYLDGVDRDTLKNSKLIKSLINIIRILSIVVGIYTLVGIFDIVFSNFITTDTGLVLTGAGAIDIGIKIAGKVVLAILIVIITFLAIANAKKGEKSKILKNLLIMPIYLLVLFLAMTGADLIFIGNNEYDKERKYIERNIECTKSAYSIKTDEETIRYSGTITENEVKKNQNIINNIVSIDKKDLLENLNEEQDNKGYYIYESASLIKHNNRLLYVAPREILSSKRTYHSKTYEYTHGYGMAVASAAQTTESGNIRYIQNNDLNIKTPQIYYGLTTDNTIVTNTKENEEYDHTDSIGNEYTSVYKGKSGLNLNFWDRFILGIKKGSINLALSKEVSGQSKILLNRNIIKRAEKVLANVMYDENPYAVADDNGNIYWVLDAYTISNNYPYSTSTTIVHHNEKKVINYIRNSIKVIINAYDGTMKFYITDTTDPIAMAYRNMYPKVFEDLSSTIPESIAKNIIYPEFLYNVQSSMLEEYHNTKSEVLYRGDDSWKKATYTTVQNGKTTNNTLDSYYTMVKDGEDEKIGLIQIYTPTDRKNLSSYLVGTVENGQNKLKIYRLSSDESILGLSQLDNKIEQDKNIKKEIDSLSVTGAKVTKKMMIVPVENTLLYIEQIYQTKINESNVPSLKKVLVSSGNKVAIGNNLEEAIKNLVSQSATNIDTYTTDDLDGIIQSIIKANDNLTKSIESNDWELMGTDIKKLQELIEQLKMKEEKLNSNENINKTEK